jgi:hypothetical protein
MSIGKYRNFCSKDPLHCLATGIHVPDTSNIESLKPRYKMLYRYRRTAKEMTFYACGRRHPLVPRHPINLKFVFGFLSFAANA